MENKGYNRATPIATSRTRAPLIEQLGENETTDEIVAAIQQNILDAKVRAYDMG